MTTKVHPARDGMTEREAARVRRRATIWSTRDGGDSEAEAITRLLEAAADPTINDSELGEIARDEMEAFR